MRWAFQIGIFDLKSQRSEPRGGQSGTGRWQTVHGSPGLGPRLCCLQGRQSRSERRILDVSIRRSLRRQDLMVGQSVDAVRCRVCAGHFRSESLISNLKDLNPEAVKAGQVDGRQYMVPLDWGLDSVVYRADKVDPKEESWMLAFDDRYAGKISWWDSPWTLFVAGYALGI